jgi:hypothetical protein
VDRLGVGAAPPKDVADGIFRRRDTSSLEALRRQLLGKHAKPPPAKVATISPGKPLTDRTSKPPVNNDSDDEEGGRTTAFSSRMSQSKASGKGKNVSNTDDQPDPEGDSDEEDTAVKGNSSKPVTQPPSKRKASSYLDEILAEKNKNKKKKKKKKNEGGAQA